MNIDIVMMTVMVVVAIMSAVYWISLTVSRHLQLRHEYRMKYGPPPPTPPDNFGETLVKMFGHTPDYHRCEFVVTLTDDKPTNGQPPAMCEHYTLTHGALVELLRKHAVNEKLADLEQVRFQFVDNKFEVQLYVRRKADGDAVRAAAEKKT